MSQEPKIDDNLVQMSGTTHVLNYHVELETELLAVSSDSPGLDVYLTCRQTSKLNKELNSWGT